MTNKCLYQLREDDGQFIKHAKMLTNSQLHGERIVMLAFPHVAEDMFEMSYIDKDALNYFIDLIKKIIEKHELNIAADNNAIACLANKKEFSLSSNQIASLVVNVFIDFYHQLTNVLPLVVVLLAKHARVRQQLTTEIRHFVSSSQIIDFAGVDELKYLDAVIQETRRLYCTKPRLVRVANRNCKLDGVVINEGTYVWLAMHCVNLDSEHFIFPEQFIPDRFISSSRMRHNRDAIINEPTSCSIFVDFAVKVTLIDLLKVYDFDLCYMPSNTIEFKPGCLVTTVSNIIHVNVMRQ